MITKPRFIEQFAEYMYEVYYVDSCPCTLLATSQVRPANCTIFCVKVFMALAYKRLVTFEVNQGKRRKTPDPNLFMELS